MKRLISLITATLLAISFGAISSSSANAVSCKAFNKGTANAFHSAGAMGAGLYKLASECHGIG